MKRSREQKKSKKHKKEKKDKKKKKRKRSSTKSETAQVGVDSDFSIQVSHTQQPNLLIPLQGAAAPPTPEKRTKARKTLWVYI